MHQWSHGNPAVKFQQETDAHKEHSTPSSQAEPWKKNLQGVCVCVPATKPGKILLLCARGSIPPPLLFHASALIASILPMDLPRNKKREDRAY